MRTTIDVPEPILRNAKQVAAQHGTSVRALIFEGLQATLDRKPGKLELRDASFGDGPVCCEAIDAAIDESRETGFAG